MIRRIVKMTFREGEDSNFVQLFNEVSPVIKNFEGCISLELLRDIHQKNTFFTLSVWQSEQHLNSYRTSVFFTETWKKTNALFSEKAQAWSTQLENA